MIFTYLLSYQGPSLRNHQNLTHLNSSSENGEHSHFCIWGGWDKKEKARVEAAAINANIMKAGNYMLFPELIV